MDQHGDLVQVRTEGPIIERSIWSRPTPLRMRRYCDWQYRGYLTMRGESSELQRYFLSGPSGASSKSLFSHQPTISFQNVIQENLTHHTRDRYAGQMDAPHEQDDRRMIAIFFFCRSMGLLLARVSRHLEMCRRRAPYWYQKVVR